MQNEMKQTNNESQNTANQRFIALDDGHGLNVSQFKPPTSIDISIVVRRRMLRSCNT
jgi:hypothetical protein